MNNMYYEQEIFINLNITDETIRNNKFIDCEFNSCKISNIEISNCSFLDCRFNSCDFNNIYSDNSISKRSEFIKCNIIAIDWNSFLPTGKIQEPIYKLEDCFLKFNNFIKIKFIKFNFSNNEITESVFEECELLECKFNNCNLTGTTIVKSDIRKSDFRGANDYYIDVLSTRMKQAKFTYPEAYKLFDSLDIEIEY